MIVSIIAAIGRNGEIGKDNDLIWHLPRDMAFFKETTLGHHIITGRKNYESIPHRFRPLKGRTNIVVTRNLNYEAEGSSVVHTVEEAVDIARNNGETEAFIIGGGEIYKQSLDSNLVDRMYLTHVNGEFEADVFFPVFDPSSWNQEVIAEFPKDQDHAFDFTISCYNKHQK
jgi:dihydrofolate reductase